jgi:hypothetical protein
MDDYTENDLFKHQSTNKLTNSIVGAFPTSVNDHALLVNHKYSMIQLKSIAKIFNLKMAGNKAVLTKRIHSYMISYKYAVKIQTAYRRRLSNKYRELIRFRNTVNEEDFLSMDKLSDIPKCQFFSFNDTDGFVYGFDAMSFYQLTVVNNVKENPYTRRNFQESTINDFNTLLRLASCLKLPLNTKIEENVITPEQKLELRVVELFQTINSLGNYANYEWFMALDSIKLLRFVKELHDIWAFRCQLTEIVKHNVCPAGDPFRRMTFFRTSNICDIREGVLTIMETMINSGIDKDSKTLGSYYTLCALTLVSYNASVALPWLYQSVQPYF